MKRTSAGAVAVLLVVLAGACAAPAAEPVAQTPAAQVRAMLTAGNPWVTLSDSQIEMRGRTSCSGLAAMGRDAPDQLARINETTAPKPNDGIPDLNGPQTREVIYASISVLCPEKVSSFDW